MGLSVSLSVRLSVHIHVDLSFLPPSFLPSFLPSLLPLSSLSLPAQAKLTLCMYMCQLLKTCSDVNICECVCVGRLRKKKM